MDIEEIDALVVTNELLCSRNDVQYLWEEVWVYLERQVELRYETPFLVEQLKNASRTKTRELNESMHEILKENAMEKRER
jgi:hypothetical protein